MFILCNKLSSLFVHFTGKPSVLWLACDAQDDMIVQHLIQFDDILDVPAPDGTTAMAIALGRQNPEIVRLLLKRFLGAQTVFGQKVPFLAKEYLNDTKEEDNLKILAVRNAIKNVMQVENHDHGYTHDQGYRDIM